MGVSAIDKWMQRGLGVLAAVILFAMMLLTFVDVIMRYVFGSPLRGSFEVTELLMVVLIFAGLPLASRNDEHVVMDFLDHLMAPGLLRAVRAIVHVACSAVLCGMGWLMLVKAKKLLAYQDTSAIMHIQLAPFVYVIAVLIFLTAATHLYLAALAGRGRQG